MEIEEMKKAILAAIKNGEVSGRKIDKKGKGANISRMKKGIVVGEKVIREIQKLLEETTGKLEEKLLEENRNPQKISKELEETRGKLCKSLEEISQLKRVNTTNEIKIIELKAEIKKLEQKQPKLLEETRGKEKVLGLSLVQKTDHGQLYWYAFKMYQSKMHWVYIGKDKSKAREKIEKWLTERGMSEDIFV